MDYEFFHESNGEYVHIKKHYYFGDDSTTYSVYEGDMCLDFDIADLNEAVDFANEVYEAVEKERLGIC